MGEGVGVKDIWVLHNQLNSVTQDNNYSTERELIVSEKV